MFVRLISLLMLALTLAACADPSAASVTAITLPSSQPAAATLVPRATILPTQPPTAMPTAVPTAIPTAVPTATPTAPATSTPEPATPTALAVATKIPATPATPAALRHVFPVQADGKVSYGRFHHDYPAADIFCPIGSVFVAVTDGVVDFVSREDVWNPKVNDGATRGGLSVAIVGDDGVRYYGSHLSQIADGIAPGVRVIAGQQLGLTGKSGDARFTDAHLHFGISHPTTPEDWAVRRGERGPYVYLRAWQRGEDVTPSIKN